MLAWGEGDSVEEYLYGAYKMKLYGSIQKDRERGGEHNTNDLLGLCVCVGY